MTHHLFKSALFALVFNLFLILPVAATQTDITGAAASDFGRIVKVLPNGNIVVTAPLYDIPAGAANVGAGLFV